MDPQPWDLLIQHLVHRAANYQDTNKPSLQKSESDEESQSEIYLGPQIQRRYAS